MSSHSQKRMSAVSTHEVSRRRCWCLCFSYNSTPCLSPVMDINTMSEQYRDGIIMVGEGKGVACMGRECVRRAWVGRVWAGSVWRELAGIATWHGKSCCMALAATS